MVAINNVDTIGTRLRLAREARELGSAELSLGIGCSHGFVSEVERGKSKSVQADIAIRLARALNVPIVWLVLGEGKSPSFTARRKAARR